MSYVYIYPISVPSVRRDKRQAIGGGYFSVGGTVTTIINNNTVAASVAAKAQIAFTDDDTPTIVDYNTLYATTFGQLPTARLWIYQTGGNYKEVDIRPEMVMISGLIDSIKFDLGTPQTGFIILS